MADQDIRETYVDGIGSISFSGGVVRADLVKLIPDPNDNTKNTVEVVQRLIISPQGFLQTANVVNDLVKKLTEAGIIQQRPADDKPAKEKSKKAS